MSADVTALKRGKGGGGGGGIHHRCTVKKTKTRRETIRRVKVAAKRPRKGVDAFGYFTPRDLYLYLTLDITK